VLSPQDWRRRHLPILESECPGLPDTGAAKKKQISCYEAGLCLCHGRGVGVRSIRTAFIAELKRMYPMPVQRQLLYDGFAVIHLRRDRAVVDSDTKCPGGFCVFVFVFCVFC